MGIVEAAYHRWRDMAEIILEANPGATPQPGVCFVSADKLWSVARVDVNDEAKGWAVWFAGQRRIGDHLYFRDADVAKVFALLVSLPVRGLAGVLQVAGRARRLALSAVAAAARLVAAPPDAPRQDGTRTAETFADRERALAGGGQLLERVAGYEFADAPTAVAFRCLATAARLGNTPASMLAVPRGTQLQPTDIRLMRTPEGLHIAGTRVEVHEVVRRARVFAASNAPAGSVAAATASIWQAPRLTEADVHAALGYAEAHPDEFADLDAAAQEGA